MRERKPNAQAAPTPALRMADVLEAYYHATEDGPPDTLSVGIGEMGNPPDAIPAVGIIINDRVFAVLPAEARKLADVFEEAMTSTANNGKWTKAQVASTLTRFGITDTIMGLRVAADKAEEATQ